MSRVGIIVGLTILGLTFAGCVEPAPAPPGWQRDPETGIDWRPVTEAEKERWHRDEYRIYVFRVPGLMDRLREEDQVTFPVRVFGGFLEADLTFVTEGRSRIEGDDPREETKRRFAVSEPWRHAWFTLPDRFYMAASADRWQYTVTTPFSEWAPVEDVRPDDLITLARPPCAESGPSGHNATAACVRYEAPEGY